jgi:hypothetical protein
MRRLAIACVVLAACSRLFGLDGVTADDRDGDHWPDAIDNCPDDFNPDQSDVDHDGIGDRCQLCESPSGLDDDGDGIPNECDGCDNRLPDDNHDDVPDACEHLNDAGMIVILPPDAACPLCQPCALGPPHDEDGDTAADACDNCPIFPAIGAGGSDLGDVDGDGVGDLCDVSTDPSHQVFDAFSEPNQSWYQTGLWLVSGDELHVMLDATAKYRQLGSGKLHFAVRTSMTAVGSLIGQANAGVAAARGGNLDSSMFDEHLQCGLRADESTNGAALVLEISIPQKPTTSVSMPLPAATHYRVELEYDLKAAAIHCVGIPADGVGTPVQLTLPEGSPSTENWATGLFAAPGIGSATFAYYDLVTDN